jgi:hypothetical protein
MKVVITMKQYIEALEKAPIGDERNGELERVRREIDQGAAYVAFVTLGEGDDKRHLRGFFKTEHEASESVFYNEVEELNDETGNRDEAVEAEGREAPEIH